MSSLWVSEDKDLTGWTFPDLKWGTAPWLMLYGSPGSGKTEYSRKWIQDCQRAGDPTEAYLIQTVEFISYLKDKCKTAEEIGHHLDKLRTTPRIAIDDLGYEPPEKFNKFGTDYKPHEIMSTTLYMRHSQGLRTQITSNLNLDTLGKIYDRTESKRGRTFDRMVEFATRYYFKGSRRRKNTDGTQAEQIEYHLRYEAQAICKHPILPRDKEEQQVMYDKPMNAKEKRDFRRQIKKYDWLRLRVTKYYEGLTAAKKAEFDKITGGIGPIKNVKGKEA